MEIDPPNDSPDASNATATPPEKHVERHLFIGNRDFLITPNGGDGDCAFFAISQAISRNESDHAKIRQEVVDFLVNHRWEKFSEAIEFQHVLENRSLKKAWASQPKEAYQKFMSTARTLAADIELNAAGDLFHYNLVIIQNYTDPETGESKYRVENCRHFQDEDEDVPFHYFYFTGAFESGHWESLTPLSGFTDPLPDALYPGQMKIYIDGLESSVEEYHKLKARKKRSPSNAKTLTLTPPTSAASEFICANNRILLKGSPYRIAKRGGKDLFPLLSGLLFPGEEVTASWVDRLERQIVTYRTENEEALSEKLLTQPEGHGFEEAETLPYVGGCERGNVWDLAAAAELFDFRFQIFFTPEPSQGMKSCQFAKEEEGEKKERFFQFVMRLVPGEGGAKDGKVSRWWHATPVKRAFQASKAKPDTVDDGFIKQIKKCVIEN